MPEKDQQDWTAYSVRAKPNRPTTSCQALETVRHVTHIRHALSVLDDARIRRRLVYDESRLNSTRVHVVWLSPNNWNQGSRYGNVEFVFDWRTLIAGRQAFWVGAAVYQPIACRILLSATDYSQLGFKPYDPALGDGPWWYDTANDKHWWNGDYCLEVLVESDVSLGTATNMTFTSHHPQRCNNDPGGGCRDARYAPHEAGAELVAAWASSIYAKRTFPASCRSGVVNYVWNHLLALLADPGEWGTVDADHELAPILGRAMLAALARRDTAESQVAARQFSSKAALVDALAKIVEGSFSIGPGVLPKAGP